ncbi:DUF1295-domain-containing protein, partial [Neoconidiobolus thromboides FSU 785]
ITAIIVSFLLSTFTGNYSTIDKLWSILPVLHSWVYFYFIKSNKTLLITSLITVWGLRLTYNFYRKGGYNFNEEDYRWKPIREFILTMTKSSYLNNVLLHLFSFFFISFFQSHLLWALTLPMACFYFNPISSITLKDGLIASGFILFLIIEIIADEQQFEFQIKKYKLIKQYPKSKNELKGDYSRGFLTKGIFYYSRHANFLAEQMMWLCISLFGKDILLLGYNVKPWYPALILCSLFYGSTWFTERLSILKYPTYTNYQKRTGKFLP